MTPEPNRALDVAALPSFGFGHRSLTWWGLQGIVAIEATVFALAIGSYLYLATHAARWPPSEGLPDPIWGSLNTAILLASAWPNQIARRRAERYDRRSAQRWMLVCLAFAVVFIVLRVFEFRSLGCRWDSSAYGSIVWMLLGLHTVHLVTDTWDTAVLALVCYTRPFETRRFVDISENAVYWYFVVASWLPIYTVIYWLPRW